MNKEILARRWIRAAALYLLAGVALGNFMGATHSFALRSVHAHINLLGWASMLGVGLLVKVYGNALNLRLAVIQFWLHQVGVLVMVLSLAALQSGLGSVEPLLGVSSVAVALAALLLVVNLFSSRVER